MGEHIQRIPPYILKGATPQERTKIMSLSDIEVRHGQKDFPGVMLMARDGKAYVHGRIPPETFEEAFPGLALSPFDHEACELLAERNLAAIKKAFSAKYDRGEHSPFDHAGSTRPLVILTGQDLLDMGEELTAEVLRIGAASGFRSNHG